MANTSKKKSGPTDNHSLFGSPDIDRAMREDALKQAILDSFVEQGFTVKNEQVLMTDILDKGKIRKLHASAVREKIAGNQDSKKWEPKLLSHIANGNDIVPSRIDPKLVEVTPKSIEERLFRYACLHWSIPVSSGYGRRLRFLVVDQQNECLMGVIGLGDPVFALGARDQWVGWSAEQRKERLSSVMDAFVLGAVPPYSKLLVGKLIAMLVTSTEVRQSFINKYQQSVSIISNKAFSGELAMVTTSSALGRSSIYNRLRYKERLLFQPLGFTKGHGDFQFGTDLYQKIAEYVEEYATPSAKNQNWGKGFRNRREIVRIGLKLLGLSYNWSYHGIQREVFAVPLAENTCAFLNGSESKLSYYDQTVDQLHSAFMERWLLPRSHRDDSYSKFDRSEYVLWDQGTLPMSI